MGAASNRALLCHPPRGASPVLTLGGPDLGSSVTATLGGGDAFTTAMAAATSPWLLFPTFGVLQWGPGPPPSPGSQQFRGDPKGATQTPAHP